MNGLVLAGGGAKGAYQVGAYLAFVDENIDIDGVVGTSIGAFNAAVIVSGKYKELYEFWKNVDVGKLLNLRTKFVDSVNNEERFKQLIYGIEEMTLILKNKGINQDNLKLVLDEIVNEKKVRRSHMDYGLVTVRARDLKPLYIFKEEMTEGKLSEYILASCNLPVFQKNKLIDDRYYLDGGFYDTNPINMLLNKGYDRVYSVEINGIGLYKKAKDKSKVIRIIPSRPLGSTLNVNKKRIRENIKIGYFDTLKVLKNYDGNKFVFKNHSDLVYNMLAKKVNEKTYTKCQKYFNTKNNRDLILSCLEYIMLKEEYTYFKVYNIRYLIKDIKKKYNKKHFVYEFINSL